MSRWPVLCSVLMICLFPCSEAPARVAAKDGVVELPAPPIGRTAPKKTTRKKRDPIQVLELRHRRELKQLDARIQRAKQRKAKASEIRRMQRYREAIVARHQASKNALMRQRLRELEKLIAERTSRGVPRVEMIDLLHEQARLKKALPRPKKKSKKSSPKASTGS